MIKVEIFNAASRSFENKRFGEKNINKMLDFVKPHIGNVFSSKYLYRITITGEGFYFIIRNGREKPDTCFVDYNYTGSENGLKVLKTISFNYSNTNDAIKGINEFFV